MVPQAVVTTTPKPIPPVKDMLEGRMGPTVVTRGSLLDNRANLAEGFVEAIMGAYEGTRLEQQEIHGQVLTSVEGALWDMDLIHRWRVRWDQIPTLGHICIGVDPSGSETGDECGIVALGRASQLDSEQRKHVYVIEDRSVRNRPSVWGPEVIRLRSELEELFPGVRVTVSAEINYGGQMVVDTLAVRDPALRVDQVVASKAKRIRAEPVADPVRHGPLPSRRRVPSVGGAAGVVDPTGADVSGPDGCAGVGGDRAAAGTDADDGRLQPGLRRPPRLGDLES